MTPRGEPQSRFEAAALAAALLAVDPGRLRGIWVRARPGLVRDAWLDCVRSLFPEATFGKLPLNAAADSLFGGLDLSATLASGRLVREPGLLRRLTRGVLVIPLADLLQQALSARLAAWLDAFDEEASSLYVLAFDESEPQDGPAAPALADRLALQIDLTSISINGVFPSPFGAREIAAARAMLPSVQIPDGVLAGICQASIELGISSLRAPVMAVAAARASAALQGRVSVAAEDAEIAARFVLAHRAAAVPIEDRRTSKDDRDRGESEDGAQGRGDDGAGTGEMTEIVLSAARASLPPDLVSRVPIGSRRGAYKSEGGRLGPVRFDARRGRPRGTAKGTGRGGECISVAHTIRAAAPWQRLRRQEAGDQVAKLHVRRDDLRVRRFEAHAQTTTIFAVDASGSSAMQRLAEAKGAVELLLAECYIRRDEVGLVAFRGEEAILLLPPTRALVRAKRQLASLAGGGGTPLASGIQAAAALAARTQRRGRLPIVILLTDGRANITLNGQANREAAHAEAVKAGRLLRKDAVPSLLVDTSRRPDPRAAQIAREMGALYLPLPHADARSIAMAAQTIAKA